MFRSSTFIMLFIAGNAGTASADTGPDCSSFGIESVMLTAHFCSELAQIAEGGGTRTVVPEGDPDVEFDESLAAIGIINEAYRVDPKKTLELIARIKEAGGLTTQ